MGRRVEGESNGGWGGGFGWVDEWGEGWDLEREGWDSV